MKNRSKALLVSLFICALSAQPAFARDHDDDDDRWEHQGRGHGYGHHKHEVHEHWVRPPYPYVVYEPARVYYYEPPRVVYYPQPVYTQPVYSFSWLFH